MVFAHMRPLVIAVAAMASLACTGPGAAARPSPLVGTKVEVTAKALDGRAVALPAPGVRVTVVDFWATWCEPCREQLPDLDRLAAAWRGRGVEVYAISFDEDRGAVDEFVARTPVGFPVLWDKGGGALADRLALTRLPTTILLDAAGVVRAVHLGYDGGQPAALERDVRRVLGE